MLISFSENVTERFEPTNPDPVGPVFCHDSLYLKSSENEREKNFPQRFIAVHSAGKFRNQYGKWVCFQSCGYRTVLYRPQPTYLLNNQK